MFESTSSFAFPWLYNIQVLLYSTLLDTLNLFVVPVKVTHSFVYLIGSITYTNTHCGILVAWTVFSLLRNITRFRIFAVCFLNLIWNLDAYQSDQRIRSYLLLLISYLIKCFLFQLRRSLWSTKDIRGPRNWKETRYSWRHL